MTRFKPQIVIVILFICFGVYNSYADCPDGIIAYWQLDEEVPGIYVDEISALNAACTNCPNFVAEGAVRDKGAQAFNGSNDILSINSHSSFNWSNTDGFSIELWMKRGPVSKNEILIARKDSASFMEWKIQLSGTGLILFTLTDQSGYRDSIISSKQVDNSVWHHIVVARNGSRTTLYIDGKVEDSSSRRYRDDFQSATASITIGGIEDADPKYFGGTLDEVAIYGTDLSPYDIQAHYYLSRQYCGLFESVVRIMPMGDSITDDNKTAYGTTGNSYRKPLWDDLNDNLFWVDFVGNRHNETDDFDNDHAGHPGITDDELASLLETGYWPSYGIETDGPYLAEYPTDVVLLHIGTNDLEDNTAGVENILNQIDSADFRTTVIVARIIDRIPENSLTHQFNDSVEELVDDRIAAGDKLIKVDMEDGTGLYYDYVHGHFVDYLHPSDDGYLLMADQWYIELNNFLPKVTAIPNITSSPVTTANKGEVYYYDVEATGTPSPTFQLSTFPAGMTIDEHSGLITWTPADFGDVSVTVEAANVGADWGQDTQVFTISVNNTVPSAISDAYTVSEGGNLTKNDSAGVLVNDSDEDGDTLTAVLATSPSHGTLIFDFDGSFIYHHDGSENFTDSFTYKASDGKTESEAVTVTISISPVNDGNIPATPVNDHNIAPAGGGCFIQGLLPVAWNLDFN